MKLPLDLKPGWKDQREPVAWLIPGAEVSRWFEEMARWDADDTGWRLAIIASARVADEAGSGAAAVKGVLVFADKAIEPARNRTALPWGCLAGRLFVPVDAVLEPRVDEEELRSLLPADNPVIVWHPHLGLIGYEESDLLTVADLLSPPSRKTVEWDRAQPGMAMAERLVSLTAVMPDQSGDVIEEGRDDIGSEPDSLGELPPAPDEHQPGPIDRALKAFRERIAGAAHQFASGLPANASGPTWVNKLDDWARRVLNDSKFGLNGSRMNELKRLLRLLETDPESGLRKALPFGLRGDAHRGESPGSQLADRDVDFDLSRVVAGGGPADFWEIPWDIRVRLEAKYRELANREIALGRSRRAAYILGELLGDYSSAAKALEDGGHYHEASVVFRDHLNQPLQAARCLERGGLLHQAIPIYEEHEQFEEAARLHEQLEQFDAAEENWRQAVSQCGNRGDYVRAASISHQHLRDPDQALGILQTGAREGAQSGQCLTEWFKLSGELGQHENSSAFVRELSRSSGFNISPNELSRILSRTATNYPDASVRHDASDATRLLVASQLDDTDDRWERHQLLDAVRDLDPSDRLLARDCMRFAKTRKRKPKKERPMLPAPEPAASTGTLVEYLSWRLEGGDIAVCGSNRSLYLASGDLDDRWLEVWKCPWDSISRRDVPLNRSKVSFDLTGPATSGRVRLAVSPADHGTVLVHVVDCPPLERKKFTGCQSGAVAAGGAEFLDESATGCFAIDRAGFVWHLTRPGATLHVHDSAGRLVRSCTLADELMSALGDDYEPITAGLELMFELQKETDIIVAHRRCLIRVGDTLLIRNERQEESAIRVEGGISSFSVSPEWTRFRVLIGQEKGMRFVGDHEERVVATELEHPSVAFLAGGNMVAVDRLRCVVFNRRLAETASYTWTIPGDPVAVVPSPYPSLFAVVFADGLVRVMKVE